MCIGIFKKKDIVLTEGVLRNCFTAHRDGCGFAYIEPENVEPHFLPEPEICIEKGYFDFDKFLAAYEPHKNKTCILHFRTSTHRLVTGGNCHPFRVMDDLVFCHNGSIGFLPKEGSNDDLSDTANFNEQILKPLMAEFPTFYQTDQFKWLVENSIASHNKLIFLDKNGNHFIVHEDQGKWEQETWFSNTSYKPWDYKGDIIEGQINPPAPEVKTYPSKWDNKNSSSQNTETKDSSDEIDENDALSVEELESQLDKNGEVIFYNTVEELDAALEIANSSKGAVKA